MATPYRPSHRVPSYVSSKWQHRQDDGRFALVRTLAFVSGRSWRNGRVSLMWVGQTPRVPPSARLFDNDRATRKPRRQVDEANGTESWLHLDTVLGP